MVVKKKAVSVWTGIYRSKIATSGKICEHGNASFCAPNDPELVGCYRDYKVLEKESGSSDPYKIERRLHTFCTRSNALQTER